MQDSHHPNTPARSSGTNISDIVPPPLLIPTLPKKPDSVRTAIKHSKFGLNAVGICSKLNRPKHIIYNLRRPKVSLSGASIKGPIPRNTTNPVVAPTTAVTSTLRSFAISVIPGVNMLEARGERMAMSAMIATLSILRRRVHCRGSSGSSFPKEISVGFEDADSASVSCWGSGYVSWRSGLRSVGMPFSSEVDGAMAVPVEGL